MADAAMLGEQRRTARRIGGDPRGQADPIAAHQVGCQLSGLDSHHRAVTAPADLLAEAGDALLQGRLAGIGRQGRDQPLQHSVELQLLLVFATVDHLAVEHRGRVVGAQIAQQVQGLGRALGLGQGGQAAQRQYRQQQPAQESTGSKHE
ncbi:hypothetical protein D3C81_1523870 [compost metagenome]